MYGNLDLVGLTSIAYTRSNTNTLNMNRLTYNVVQSCVDTLAAKISSKKPKPMFLTEDGDWAAAQKAKKLNKYVDGAFYGLKVYDTTGMNFMDAGVFGTAFAKVFSDSGKICVERVTPNEIKIDDADGFYGSPLTMYQIKAINKDVLIALYPKHEQAIKSAPSPTGANLFINQHADQTEVIEAWHLPIVEWDGNKRTVVKPGKHVIALQGASLFQEDWDRDYFPFATFQLNPKLWGCYGQGIPEQLMGEQLEINRLLRSIQTAHYLCSSPMWMVNDNAKVITSHLNNQIGNIVKWQGMVPPDMKVFPAVAPELYSHLYWLIQSCYEKVGISQLSATSQKPAGLNSGKALREYNDIETERFLRVGQRWEQFHLDIATLIINESKHLYKTQKVNTTFKSAEKNFASTIKWSEINLTDEQYVMKAYPTSAFSSTPAAKLQEVSEYIQAGMIPPDMGMRLLDFPDLDQYRSLAFARKEVVEMYVQKILDGEEYQPPEPYMDLEYAQQFTMNAYNRAKIQGAPEEVLEPLRQFQEQVDEMLALAAQAAQPMANTELMPPPEAAVPGVSQNLVPVGQQ
jgi:hypothetical protein